jgi:hypothetical protein
MNSSQVINKMEDIIINIKILEIGETLTMAQIHMNIVNINIIIYSHRFSIIVVNNIEGNGSSKETCTIMVIIILFICNNGHIINISKLNIITIVNIFKEHSHHQSIKTAMQ